MVKDNNKLEITYKDKKYLIEPKKEVQTVKPKGEKDTDPEITVRNYEEGGFFTSHKCECSENGTNFEKIDIKWGVKKHITIWGIILIALIVLGLAGYFCFRETNESEKEEA